MKYFILSFLFLLFLGSKAQFENIDSTFKIKDDFYSVFTDVVKFAEAEDGKLLAGGIYYIPPSRVSIVRLNIDGSEDATFYHGIGLRGVDRMVVYDLAIQPDGKIILAGEFRTYDGYSSRNVLRINPNGVVDSSFYSNVTEPVIRMALLNDGKIIVAELVKNSSDVQVYRLNNDGSLDNSFSKLLLDEQVNSFHPLKDGKVLMGGRFSEINGQLNEAIARLNQDGTVDESFNSKISDENPPNYIHSIIVQNNGKIVAAGDITSSENKYIDVGIIRLNSDGSEDTTFRQGTGINHLTSDYWPSILSMLEQPDGKIILCGKFKDYDGQNVNNICRINSDGSFDSTFNVGSGPNDIIRQIYRRKDGRILISGRFTEFNGQVANTIAQINAGLVNNKCSFSTSFNVNEFNCQYGNRKVKAKAYSGDKPFSFSWLSSFESDGDSIEIEETGLYSCEVSDNNGCKDTVSIWVETPSSKSSFDLKSNIVASELRVGFGSTIDLLHINSGCKKKEGEVKLVSSNLLEYKDSYPSPIRIDGDTLVWNFFDLDYENGVQKIRVNFRTSLSAAIGDTVKLNTIISPSFEDSNSANNFKAYKFPIVNGYDPNDIQVQPIGECKEKYVNIDEILTYKIRFQNTGNSKAINISVVDSLPSELNINSLNVIGSSHPMYSIIKNNVIKFQFDSIQLPDSSSNELESHGYVVFEISPNNSIEDISLVKNKAEIYFDYNPAVVTNTIKNTFVNEMFDCDIPTSISSKNSHTEAVIVHPNPSEGILNINSEVQIGTVEIFESLGKKVVSTTNKTQIDISGLNSGIYYLKIFNQVSEIISTVKIIKK